MSKRPRESIVKSEESSSKRIKLDVGNDINVCRGILCIFQNFISSEGLGKQQIMHIYRRIGLNQIFGIITPTIRDRVLKLKFFCCDDMLDEEIFRLSNFGKKERPISIPDSLKKYFVELDDIKFEVGKSTDSNPPCEYIWTEQEKQEILSSNQGCSNQNPPTPPISHGNEELEMDDEVCDILDSNDSEINRPERTSVTRRRIAEIRITKKKKKKTGKREENEKSFLLLSSETQDDIEEDFRLVKIANPRYFSLRNENGSFDWICLFLYFTSLFILFCSIFGFFYTGNTKQWLSGVHSYSDIHSEPLVIRDDSWVVGLREIKLNRLIYDDIRFLNYYEKFLSLPPRLQEVIKEHYSKREEKDLGFAVEMIDEIG